MSFEEFVRQLTKHLFVWQMARADRRENSGKELRMSNAKRAIDLLIAQYTRAE